jgi:AraC-like DNA-binding protein
MTVPFSYEDPVVPPHHPRVLLETAVEQGADEAAVLAKTGITRETLENPEARVSYLQFGRLVNRALRMTRNPALGLDYGRNIRLSHMGMLGLAVMSSETAGAALSVALRHYRILSPAWELSLRVVNGRAILSARETLSLAPFSRFATEGLLMAFVSLGRTLRGGSLPMRALRLAYGSPEYAARYGELLDLSPTFDASLTEFEFDAALLDAPIASADPATATLAEQYCDARAPSGPGSTGLIVRVRRVLGAAHGPAPDLERLAEVLDTTPRTLRRTLRDMQTSYTELLEESRRGRAEAWVRATSMTFEQIASELGFCNVRSFRRAFKRWTGDTPGAVRAAALREEPRLS